MNALSFGVDRIFLSFQSNLFLSFNIFFFYNILFYMKETKKFRRYIQMKNRWLFRLPSRVQRQVEPRFLPATGCRWRTSCVARLPALLSPVTPCCTGGMPSLTCRWLSVHVPDSRRRIRDIETALVRRALSFPSPRSSRTLEYRQGP